MSLIPAPSQHVQFISVGHQPLQSSHSAALFYDEINSIFELSNFGTEEADLEPSDAKIERRRTDQRIRKDQDAIRRLNGQRKGIDRWPMFFVRIEFNSSETSDVLEEIKGEATIADQWIEKTLGLLRSMVVEFLSAHDFHPRASRNGNLRQSNLDLIAIESESQLGMKWEPRPYQAALQPTSNDRTFRNWSRIKVGKINALSDPIHDLPTPKNQTTSGSPFSTLSSPQSRLAKVELALTAMDHLELESIRTTELLPLLEDPANGSDIKKGSISLAVRPDPRHKEVGHIQRGVVPSSGTTSPAVLAEDTVLWTNPSNGHEVKINARTGLAEQGIPSRSSSSLTLQARSASAASHRAHKGRSPTAMPSRDLLLQSILDNNLAKTFRKLEEPISSIVMTEPDEATHLRVRGEALYSRGHAHKQISDYVTDPTTSSELRLSKADIKGANVLAQVDQKFVLLQAQTKGRAAEDEDVLILVDQHAADERIKVEELYCKLCNVSMVSLMKPIVFEVSDGELALFEARKRHFLDWGIIYDPRMASSSPSLQEPAQTVPWLPAATGQVVVRALPELIVERCRLEPKILIDLLRREIWSGTEKQPLTIEGSNENSWISKLPHCPKGLLDMINSRACRSAVMFNDDLSREQCEVLMKSLARCVFPFQCAHGRPTMVVLPRLGQTGNVDQARRDRPGSFAQAFKKWQACRRERTLVQF